MDPAQQNARLRRKHEEWYRSECRTIRNERILKLVDEGKTFTEVAAILGTTRSTVSGVCYRSTKVRANA